MNQTLTEREIEELPLEYFVEESEKYLKKIQKKKEEEIKFLEHIQTMLSHTENINKLKEEIELKIIKLKEILDVSNVG